MIRKILCWLESHDWMYWAEGWPGNEYSVMRGCHRCGIMECLGKNEYESFHSAMRQRAALPEGEE